VQFFSGAILNVLTLPVEVVQLFSGAILNLLTLPVGRVARTMRAVRGQAFNQGLFTERRDKRASHLLKGSYSYAAQSAARIVTRSVSQENARIPSLTLGVTKYPGSNQSKQLAKTLPGRVLRPTLPKKGG
jgi:hypothetical protein